MAQTYQPKEYVFSGTTFTTALNTNGNNLTVYTEYPIVGEVLDVAWKFNRTGSLYLTESGTGREIIRVNAPSGIAGWQFRYPRVFGQDGTAGSIAGATQFLVSTAAPLAINISGAASGTQLLDVMFRFR